MKNEYTIAIGADHRGYHLKNFLKAAVYSTNSISWIDVGAHNDKRSDYPLFARAVCQEILKQNADYGIVICGSGLGMAMAANRFPRMYAGVAWNEETARLAKEDDNVNVLALPADFINEQQAYAMVNAWWSATFKHDRYEKRLAMVDAIKL